MLDLLWLIPTLPIAGFAVLALAGKRMAPALAAGIGVGTVGVSAALAAGVAVSFLNRPPPEHVFTQTLWQWINVSSAGGNFSADIALHLDALSLLMMLVVTAVGFLIHVYSVQYMSGDEGYSRFFAYMNLFVGAMLTLVLADNLAMLLVGWEGVGLCSYLLIGFWYKEHANARAARKAFIVTRVGDTAMMIGLLLLFTQLGTLEISKLMQLAPAAWAAGSTMPIIVAALLLGGALGKSAQLPLQTWLPDAMAGPTPVSALIHAATMVTAGVYLIARTRVIFELAPPVLLAVGVVGAATLLYAGCSALAQRDIKRVLAYSTISQIGYMFLALGVGAFSAAMLHFMTHAMFKSLLFLAAGAVILAMGEEHDIRKMGGLRKRMPVTFWTFLIGAASLSALPLATAGFYSKDLILQQAWNAGPAGRWLFGAGLAGAFITSLYSFRVVFAVFFGQAKKEVAHRPGKWMLAPLIVLAAMSVVGGFVEMPSTLGNVQWFSSHLEPVFGRGVAEGEPGGSPLTLQLVSGGVSILGIFVAYVVFHLRPGISAAIARGPIGSRLGRFWLGGWGFDWVYQLLFVRPVVWIARVNRDDIVDSFFDAVAYAFRLLHRGVSLTQTGNLRWYAAGVALGAIAIFALAVLL